MKRSFVSGESPATVDGGGKMKKVKIEEDEEEDEVETSSGIMGLDENLLFEVLKHADAKTLAAAACVSKLWHRTAVDERLWELICTKHWAKAGCGNRQLRSVVLALGGFRRLHALYIWPLSKPQSGPSTAPPSAWGPLAPVIAPPPAATRWGKDEVHLSLSLLSIRFYEKMSSGSRNR